MWTRHARTRVIECRDPELNWTAEHDGYAELGPRPGTGARSGCTAGPPVEIVDVSTAAPMRSGWRSTSARSYG